MPSRRLTRNSRAPATGDTDAARMAAVSLLARRDFARRELREKLTTQGFDEDTVIGLIEAFTREGTLDDGRYAQNYVAYHVGRGQGPMRIAAELRRRGLAGELIDAALASGPDWSALARKVCRAKFGPQPPATWTQRARQARFLQYRGFSSDHIRAATGAEPDTGFTDL
jgi:regulatory protein